MNTNPVITAPTCAFCHDPAETTTRRGQPACEECQGEQDLLNTCVKCGCPDAVFLSKPGGQVTYYSFGTPTHQCPRCGAHWC